MKKLFIVGSVILMTSCAPRAEQQIKPYTAAFKASPEQIFSILEGVPVKIPNQACQEFKIFWGISYGNPTYTQTSPQEAVVIVDAINIAKTLSGVTGHEFKFFLKQNGDVTSITANQTWYKRGGNEINPILISNCIPSIFETIAKSYTRVQ